MLFEKKSQLFRDNSESYRQFSLNLDGRIAATESVAPPRAGIGESGLHSLPGGTPWQILGSESNPPAVPRRRGTPRHSGTS